MRRAVSGWLAVVVAVGWVTNASAFGPGSGSRNQHAGATCQSGPDAGRTCNNETTVCAGGAQCAITPDPSIEIRALVTLIADKDAGGPDPFSPPTSETDQTLGPLDPIPIPDTLANSTLTAIFEFSHGGQDYLFAEIYQDVDFPLWLPPAVEYVVARESVDLEKAGPGEDLAQAIATAVGAAAGTTIYSTQAVPLPMPAGADQADENEVLASVRRYKLILRAPVAAPLP